MSANPFFRAAPTTESAAPEPVEPDPITGTRVRMSGPKLPIETVPPPERPVLGRVKVAIDPLVWVVGVHGGAAATSVSHVIEGSAECVRAWPIYGTAHVSPRVLLVSRSHRSGLDCLANAVQEWASGDVPWVQLIGTLIVDDGPKLPPEVRPQVTQLLQATPLGWHLRWQPSWRHLPLTERPVSRPARKTLANVSAEAQKARA